MSSIYADLKTLTKDNLTRMIASKRAAMPAALKHTVPPPTEPPYVPPSIDAIAAGILPPMCPLRDNKGYIYDTGTLAIKCSVGHIHKYYISDLIAAQPVCRTCSSGTQFSKRVRELAEATLGVPFALDCDSGQLDYVNPVMRIVLECYNKKRTVDETLGQSRRNGYLVIRFHHTTIQKTMKATLFAALDDYIGLTEAQREAVMGLVKSIREAPSREALPYSPELAAIVSGRNHLNVVSGDCDYLRLENC